MIKKYYTVICINIATIMIIFFSLNTLAFCAGVIIKKYFPHYLPTQSISELKDLYPELSESEILQLLAETWDEPWVYEPWVGFKEKPRKGKFVNISPEGFRLSNNEETLDAAGVHIFVFGGSTTFGYGLDDRSTIPFYLEMFLSEKFPGKEINVFNFGRGYYYSSQELTLLIDLIRNKNIPSIAIFIDGLNEGQNAPFFSEELRHIFKSYNYDKIDNFINFASKLSLLKSINWFFSKYNVTENVKEIDPSLSVSNYVRNKSIINSIATIHGFKTYFFIQPVPGYNNTFRTHKFMPLSVRESEFSNLNRRMYLLENTVDNINSFSLTKLLENYISQPFVDEVHYTSDVCMLIAKNISEKIEL